MTIIQLLDALWTRCYEQRVLRAEEARRWVAKSNSIGIPNPNFRRWTPWAEERIKERHDWSKKQVVVAFIQQHVDFVGILLVQVNLY
jgi:hypothetical protein